MTHPFAKNGIPLGRVVDAMQSLRREFYSDYDAARESRFVPRMRGVNPSGSAADYHYRNEADFYRIIERARNFVRNNSLLRQGLWRVVNNVLQEDGITPDPTTGDDDLNQQLYDRWVEWTEDPRKCDISRENTFRQLARVALFQAFSDGDIIFLGLKSGELQGIEAHRVRSKRNNNVIHGVELNEFRERVKYHVSKEEIDPNKAVGRNAQIDTYSTFDGDIRQIFHLYVADRLSQTRGVTVLAPVCDTVGMGDDLMFAKLVQAQMVSFIALFRYQDPSAPFTQGAQPFGTAETETQADGSIRRIEEVTPGAIIECRPGERMEGFSPNVPNAEFFQHANLILTIVAVNLGIPLAVLLLDPSNTNFSGWRGAIDQARTGFRAIQQWMVERFYQPVWLWKLNQWAADDPQLAKKLAANPKSRMVTWHRPNWAYIEPKTDAEADVVRLDRGLISPRRLHAERGRDWDDVHKEIVDDRVQIVAYAVAKAAELNAAGATPPVDWRELAAFPAIKTAVPAKEEEKANDAA